MRAENGLLQRDILAPTVTDLNVNCPQHRLANVSVRVPGSINGRSEKKLELGQCRLLGLGQNASGTIGSLVGSGLGISALALVVYVLYEPQFPVPYFHVIYLTSLALLAVLIYLILNGSLNPEFFIVSIPLLLSLRLLTVLRAPDLLLHDPDSNFLIQMVTYVFERGNLPLGSGTGPFLTGEAVNFSHFPGLQILLTATVMVTGIPVAYWLKFAGSFVGLLMVFFVERFLRLVIGNRALSSGSAILAGMYPYLQDESYIVNETIAWTLLFLFVASSLKHERRWTTVSIICLAGITVSHGTTALIGIVLLVVVKIVTYLFRRLGSPTQNVSGSLVGLAIALFVAWWSYVALYFIQGVSSIFTLSIGGLSARLVSPTGLKPEWVVILQYVGFGVFAASSGLSLVQMVRMRNSRWFRPAAYAVAGWVIFVLFLAIWSMGMGGAEIFGRSLLPFYFFNAPFALLFILMASSALRKARRIHVRMIAVLMIFLMLSPSVYYSILPMIYDSNSPIQAVDIRLYPQQWHSTADFVSSKLTSTELYGVLLAWWYVSGLSFKGVAPPGSYSPFPGLTAWVASSGGRPVIIRLSWLNVPESGYSPTPEEWNETLSISNLLYSTGEVIILVQAGNPLPTPYY